jgi:hypothetical protein
MVNDAAEFAVSISPRILAIAGPALITALKGT